MPGGIRSHPVKRVCDHRDDFACFIFSRNKPATIGDIFGELPFLGEEAAKLSQRQDVRLFHDLHLAHDREDLVPEFPLDRVQPRWRLPRCRRRFRLAVVNAPLAGVAFSLSYRGRFPVVAARTFPAHGVRLRAAASDPSGSCDRASRPHTQGRYRRRSRRGRFVPRPPSWCRSQERDQGRDHFDGSCCG